MVSLSRSSRVSPLGILRQLLVQGGGLLVQQLAQPAGGQAGLQAEHGAMGESGFMGGAGK